ncbi:DUF5995 family protein [uncultured Friedmanniella sp.]|uniref:DUF5995 family protein n=1 Tax=uncultured Friedmanniella sp. TaxID=335381 RepID=UPI0035CABD1F
MTSTAIAGLVGELDARLAGLAADESHRAPFLATYRRTTEAVGTALDGGFFLDGAWVARWTAVFGRYYLDALDADRLGSTPTRPWRLAFSVAPDVHPLGHLLVAMNAHINYDLPQAMLDVIGPADFDDAELLAARVRDHDRIDEILSGRVAAEDQALGGARRLVDRVLGPANRYGSRRFLAEARGKVWENVGALHEARLRGPGDYRTRIGELEVLASAKIAEILRPGPVLLRLATAGFGVRLPPL